jgi:hypothetical protein
VSKLNSTGSALLYSTYLGGSSEDLGFGVALDESGNAYVTGATDSSDFPTTAGAFQTTLLAAFGSVFISKMNALGSALVYSTYLGGSVRDQADGIPVDALSNAYVTGVTLSSDFPTTPGAFQTRLRGNNNAFVTKLNSAGSSLLYSTYMGGSGGDEGSDIAVGTSGNAYVTGVTVSSDFPTTPGAFQTTYGGKLDAFVAKLNAAGSSLLYSTYMGGSGEDFGSGIAIDASGNVYVTGFTHSVNFPITAGAFRTSLTGNHDAFVAKISIFAAPVLVLSPPSLTFAQQAVGTTSAVQKVRLTDGGTKPLSITSIIAGGDFAQTNDCPGTVAPAAFCTFNVTFTPTAAGRRTGAVTITDNAAGSPHKLLLTGTGSLTAVILAPASMTFPLLRTVGGTSLPQTVKLTNVGSEQLNITGSTVTGPNPGDFAQSNNCPATVALGGSCLITVTFTPAAQGVRTASVSIADNAPGSPQTVPLTGRGTFLKWSPRQINLGDQPVGTSSPAQTVVLTNAGTAPIALFSIEVGGVNAGDFTQTNTCGSCLKAGASCTIEVTFTPTAAGDRIGHVAIQDNAFGGTHWVGLLGKGT